MKVIMILDQVQSGYGTKNDKMIPLTGTKEIIGPGVIMKPYLKEIDGNIVATLYCGTGTYLENPEEVSRKLCGMVKRLNPDVVICGPSLSYADSASMCTKVAYDKITIIKTPNKGESGLREAFKNICSVAKTLVYSNEIE